MRLSLSTSLLAGALALAAFSLPGVGERSVAQAQSLENMSAEQREIFREEVRRLLRDEPELVSEALRALERRRVERALSDLNAAIADGEFVRRSGASSADLTLIELTDYDCPYCRRAQPEVAEFVRADGKVRHVVVALPYIGADTSERAVLAARMQSNGSKVDALHGALMSHNGRMTEDAMRAIIDDVGLDWDRLLVDMASPEVETTLARALETARALRIEGTPAFVMGDRVLGGLRTADELAQVARQVRAEN